MQEKEMLLMDDIIREGNPTLKEKSQNVSLPLSEEDEHIINLMIDYIFNSIDDEISEKYKLRPAVGLAENQSVFEEIVSKSSCCISYINKYQQLAIDFVDRYPFAKFMNENQIDYKTSLIKDNVNINAFLIGFGKTNQEIFLTSVANNQFITKDIEDYK